VILFLDTSALVKLYVEEIHSSAVAKAVAQADDVIVSQIALPETVSAVAYRMQRGDVSSADETRIFKQLLEDWETFARIDVDVFIAKEAAALARSRNLRGADAIQLASAAFAAREQRFVYLLAFDEKLLNGAEGVVRLWQP
jgi:uncharacterized protein